MNKITDADKGKRYFLDGIRDKEVVLHTVLPDDWAVVEQTWDKMHKTVPFGRMTEITELPVRVTDDKVELDYPAKVNKITFEIFDAEKGEGYVRILEGDDAIKWTAWMRELCYKAETVGMNPPWLELGWKQKQEKSKR